MPWKFNDDSEVRYARSVGVVGAQTSLAFSFPAFSLVQTASQAGVAVTTVQNFIAGAALLSLVALVVRLISRVALSSPVAVATALLACAGAFVALAVVPGGMTLCLALGLAVTVDRVVSPLRSYASQLFPKRRISAQQRSQAPTYVLYTLEQLAVSGVVAVAGWHWGVMCVAVALALQVVRGYRLAKVVKEHHAGRGPDATNRSPASDRRWYDLFDLPSVAPTLLALCLGGVLFQLLFGQLQPHLADVGFDAGQAGFLVAALGVTRVIALPFTTSYAKLADNRLSYATVRSSTWILASGGFILLSLIDLGPWAFVPIAVAATALEIGQLSSSAGHRGYISSLSVEGITVVALGYAGASYFGLQLAPVLSWNANAVLWAGIATIVFGLALLAQRFPLRVTGQTRDVDFGGRMTVLLLPDGEKQPGVYEMHLYGALSAVVALHFTVRERAQVRFHSDWSAESPVPNLEARGVLKWGKRPKPLNVTNGAVRWGTRVPLIDSDENQVGVLVWRGDGGSWTAHQTPEGWWAITIESRTLLRKMSVTRFRLHF